MFDSRLDCFIGRCDPNIAPALLQRVVRAYAARLVARLPKTAGGGTAGTPTLASQDWHVRLPEGDVPVCCAVVSTAEYCTEVIGALARNVAKLLDPPLGDQVRKQLLPKAHDLHLLELWRQPPQSAVCRKQAALTRPRYPYGRAAWALYG